MSDRAATHGGNTGGNTSGNSGEHISGNSAEKRAEGRAGDQGKRNRVLVLGLDGATFDLITPMVEAGDLPNLAGLMNSGAHAELHSTIQPVTAPAWSTFVTGVNQGKHGLFDFVRRRAGTYSLQVTNGRDNKGTSIFDLASQVGQRVVAVNVPYSAPPRPVNGIVVGGPFIPDLTPEQVYPTDFYSQLRKVVSNYFVTATYDPTAGNPLDEYASRILESVAIRERLSTHLLGEEAWDLFMVVFMEPDEVHHAYWHTLEAGLSEVGLSEAGPSPHKAVIPDTYRAIDEAIGRLLTVANAALDDDEALTVFVVSDHGAGPLHYMINLNQWLQEGGFLRFVDGPPRGLEGLRTRLFTNLVDAYKRYFPPGLREVIRRWLGLGRFEKIKGDLESTLLMSKIDWTQTQVYALGAGGNIFINMVGREPDGVVGPGDEFEAVCLQVSAHLQKLSDPESGKPLVKEVHRGPDLYSGPFVDEAPDLVIEWNDYGFWGRGRYDSQAATFEKTSHFEFSEQPLTGSHRPEGIFIAAGPAVKQGAKPDTPQLMDVAPTILTLLGIAPPAEMDGRLLREILTEEGLSASGPGALAHDRTAEGATKTEGATNTAGAFENAGPADGTTKRQANDGEMTDTGEITDTGEMTDEDSEKVAQRLRSLGYL